MPAIHRQRQGGFNPRAARWMALLGQMRRCSAYIHMYKMPPAKMMEIVLGILQLSLIHI